MCRDEIRSRLKSVLAEGLGLGSDILNIDDNMDKKLLGGIWKLNARDLLYLFITIEKEFNINIPQTAVVEGKFTTVNGIVAVLEKSLNAS